MPPTAPATSAALNQPPRDRRDAALDFVHEALAELLMCVDSADTNYAVSKMRYEAAVAMAHRALGRIKTLRGEP